MGADLAPGTLLAAYRQGLFPMRLQARGPIGLGPIGWWSPDPRGIIPLDGLHVSRSLRRSVRRFEVRVDTAFEEVMRGCADPRRPHGWIDEKFIAAYTELHRLGWAHSVETWQDDARGETVLVGGLYGVAHRRPVRGRVEVPPRHRRVEGRGGRARRAAAHGWRHVARRAVDHAAPGRRSARSTCHADAIPSSSPTRWRARRCRRSPTRRAIGRARASGTRAAIPGERP